MFCFKRILILSLFVMLFPVLGCDSNIASSDGDTNVDGDDSNADGDKDADIPEEDVTDDDTTVDGDTENESDEEILTIQLPFKLDRPDNGDPIPPSELSDFSERLAGLLKKFSWFDYILRNSHGVDASTGKPPYAQWWSDVDAIKEGDTVTFMHRDLPEHGGHNIGTNQYKILASSIAASLLSNDPTINQLTALYCAGVSATMKGMVHDENDPIPHLMARNVIAFNHSYTTHEGRKKVVNYEQWYHPYSRWNCERFEYTDNPYWGTMWVTNVRSKDDVGGLLRNTAMIEHAANLSLDEGVRQACGETLELLRGFCSDIVDSDYYIRTKDDNGEPFIFSLKEKPEGMRISTDLDNYITFDSLIPDSECNAKRANDWIGKRDGSLTDCGNGSQTDYEKISLYNNYPNANFYRSYHMANAYQSLLHGDNESAKLLLQGMVERFEEHMDYDLEDIPVSPDRWHMDLASALIRAAAQGYPLTSREIRLIHKYYERAMDFHKEWPYWNLWDESVPDGTHAIKPPDNDGSQGDERQYWIRIEDMSALIEYCWSPYKNPDGRSPVDCEIMGNPAKWLSADLR